MKLEQTETDLLGKWESVGNKVIADKICERIKALTSQWLQKIAGGGWETLYRDPEDGRYWELTYPESHMHGGGPPRLTYLLKERARAKYRDVAKLSS